LESARGGLGTARELMNVMTGTDYDKTRAYKSFLVAEDAYNDAALRAQSAQKHLEMLCEQMAVAAMATPLESQDFRSAYEKAFVETG
jgi:hypothetical protein